MLSKKIIISLLSVVVSVIIAVSVLLILMQNKNDTPLQINQSPIAFAYGDTFDLSDITKNIDKFSFEIKDPNIAKIENGKIKAVACGNTKLLAHQKSTHYTLDLKIFANTVAFSKSTIILHTSGNDTTENFSLLVNNIQYNISDLTYDNNIISITNNCITAKTAGITQISATLQGYFSTLTAKMDVTVKNYVYAKNIIDDEINLNIGDSVARNFVEYEDIVGDKINVQVDFDENYLSYTDGVLTALKIGTTQISISALTRAGEVISRTINVEISLSLAVASYSYSKAGQEKQTLHYSTKADGTLDTYELHLTFNKSIINLPTFVGITPSNIETTDNKTFDITFTKKDSLNISALAIDPNTNSTKSFDLQIALQKYIQTLDFELVNDNNATINDLYLFNTNFIQEANNDGKYNALNINLFVDDTPSNKNVEISNSANIKVEKINDVFVVSALSAGTAKLTISATDGSGVICTKNINIAKVVPNLVTFANSPTKIYLDNTFSLQPTFEPMYALVDFAVTFEDDSSSSQYFSHANFNFTAIKCGTCLIKICENNSTSIHTYNLTISQEYIFKYNDNVLSNELTLTAGNSSALQVLKCQQNDETLSANLGDVVITLTNLNGTQLFSAQATVSTFSNEYMAKNENELYFITTPAGEYTLCIQKDDKTIATLKIIIQ